MPKRSGGGGESTSPQVHKSTCGTERLAGNPGCRSEAGAAWRRPYESRGNRQSPDGRDATIASLFKWGKDQLHTAGVAHPDLDAEMLLRQALGISRAAFFAHLQDTVAQTAVNQYHEYIEKRVQNMPVQYIIGKQEFMGLDFHVTPDVLIPRPETEILVESVLAKLGASQSLVPSPLSLVDKESTPSTHPTTTLSDNAACRGAAMPRPGCPTSSGPALFVPPLGTRDQGLGTHPISALRIADIGTGSGAIALSLAHYLPHSQVFAVDISPAALAVAQENAVRLGVADRVTFLQGDLLAPLDEEGLQCTLHAIVSNPPYIPRDVIPTLDAHVQVEPHLALDGGIDGLDYYRRIAAGAGEYLLPGGLLAVEVGHDQAEQVAELFTAHGYDHVKIHKDLAEIGRVVMGWSFVSGN